MAPEDPEFAEKDSKRIYIPIRNEVTLDPKSLVPLRMFAKRAKFYTAIAKFAYQYHELQYAECETVDDESPSSECVARLRHFVRTLKGLSVWGRQRILAVGVVVQDVDRSIRSNSGWAREIADGTACGSRHLMGRLEHSGASF